MPDLNLPLIQTYQPTSFAERGVAVPFTTPLLAGARVRAAERTGTELVVPNPSGGRGVYILPWGSARQLCRPTVHDTRLFERLGQLPVLTPSAVRQAARAVATEGLAGREARAAGTAAATADTDECLLANFMLLMALVEEVEPGSVPLTALLQPTAELEERSKRAVAEVAPKLGRSPHQIAADLEALAVLFGPVGLSPQADRARLPRLIAALRAFRDDVEASSPATPDDDIGAVARMLVKASAQVVSAATAALQDARAAASPVSPLLRAWARTPDVVVSRIGRAEWLLDGWDRIVLLWGEAKRPPKRRAALLEMAQLVPIMPQDAADLIAAAQPDANDEECRVITLSEGWRTGPASFGLVARNERLRAQGG
ncbi:MAG TPA: hypothetical protein VGG99_05665 [Acetobacteraceae bacterium]